MAKPISSLESHPQRQRIIEAIASGRPLAEVSAWTEPAVHRAVLVRFKSRALAEHAERIKLAREAIANKDTGLEGAEQGAVQKVALGLAADPFLAHVVRQNERRGRMMDLAERDENHGAYSSHDRNDIAAVKLHAELAGRLTGAPLVAVQVVIPATGQAAPMDDDGEVIDIR